MISSFLKNALVLIASLYLFACGTTKDVATFVPVNAEKDQAIVYIYRPPVMSNALYAPDLYINDNFKFSIKNGANIHFSQNPGEYTFEIKTDKNYSGLAALPLTLNAGTSYFIRIETSLEITRSVGYQPYKRSFNLINVEEQLAVKEIAECCGANNKSTAVKSITELSEEESNKGFSIDKTQNPFSY